MTDNFGDGGLGDFGQPIDDIDDSVIEEKKYNKGETISKVEQISSFPKTKPEFIYKEHKNESKHDHKERKTQRPHEYRNYENDSRGKYTKVDHQKYYDSHKKHGDNDAYKKHYDYDGHKKYKDYDDHKRQYERYDYKRTYEYDDYRREQKRNTEEIKPSPCAPMVEKTSSVQDFLCSFYEKDVFKTSTKHTTDHHPLNDILGINQYIQPPIWFKNQESLNTEISLYHLMVYGDTDVFVHHEKGEVC